jgi:hypothetical protein
MFKKTIVFIFSLIGLLSLFLPFSKNVVIGCGDNDCFTDYYFDSLIKYLFDFFKLSSITYFDIFEISALIVVIFSVLFSPVLLFLSKKIGGLLLIVLTLIIMFIPFYNSYNYLGYGYYIILLQQTVLLIVIILSKNKILHLQKL